jgi:hypothetical protein
MALPLTKCPKALKAPHSFSQLKIEKEKKRKIVNNWKKEL